jgi:hypothetical protein
MVEAAAVSGGAGENKGFKTKSLDSSHWALCLILGAISMFWYLIIASLGRLFRPYLLKDADAKCDARSKELGCIDGSDDDGQSTAEVTVPVSDANDNADVSTYTGFIREWIEEDLVKKNGNGQANGTNGHGSDDPEVEVWM